MSTGRGSDNDDRQSVRTLLRAAVTRSMKARDRAATSTYRIALSAIENAEAVPVETMGRAGAVEGAAVGVGAADAERRILCEDDMRGIVRAEAAQLRAAAAELHRSRSGSDTPGRLAPDATVQATSDAGSDQVRGLITQADLLDDLLAGLEG